jgi:hypothetical protein
MCCSNIQVNMRENSIIYSWMCSASNICKRLNPCMPVENCHVFYEKAQS